MSVELIISIMIVSAVGGFIQRVCGFGFGIFVMMFFPYIFSKHTASSAISTMISCVMSVCNAIIYRKHIPYKKIIPLMIGAFVMIPIAVKFSVVISGDFFKKLLGAVLVILSIYFLFFNNKIRFKANFRNGIIAGGFGGILNGLFSTGGPPVVLYLMNSLMDKTVYFASTQFYFGFTGIYSTLVRVFNGIITLDVALYALIGYAGCMIGNFFGAKVFHMLNAAKIKKIIYIGMIVFGIIMIVK